MNENKKYWDDYLNPVLVKEIRQFFHNKFILALAGGLLGIQLFTLFIFNLTFSEWNESSEAGTIFIAIDTVLMYLCVLAVAVWSPMQRFIAERSSKELDFSNITLLSPWQIVGGKLASALVVWGLIVALCLPFMTVAYFFRNVTLGDIFMLLGAGVMPTLVLIQAALFCGTMGKKWVSVLLVYFILQVIGPLIIVSLASMLDHRSFGFANFCIFQGGWLILFAILLAATIAMITPPFSNRMMPLRILLCIILVPLLTTAFFMKSFPEEEAQYLILFMTMGAVSFAGFLAVCDRDEPGGRVLAQVPRNPAGRFLHYLFSSNRCGGVIFTLIILLLYGAISLLVASRMKESVSLITFGIAGYIICYCEIAILLNRKVPAMPGWGWMLVIAFVLGIIPLSAAANSDIKVAQIWISPSLLMNGPYHHTATDPAIWAAPLTAWGIGLLFVIEMFRKYKNYKAPEKKNSNGALQAEEK